MLFQFCAELAHFTAWRGARVLTGTGYAIRRGVTFGCLVMCSPSPSFPLVVITNTLWQWFVGVCFFAVHRFLLRHLLHSICRHGYNSRGRPRLSGLVIWGAAPLRHWVSGRRFYDHKAAISHWKKRVPGQTLPVLG